MEQINLRITFGDDKTTFIPDDALNDFYLKVAKCILKPQNIKINRLHHLNISTKDSIRGNFKSIFKLVEKIVEKNKNKKRCFLIHIEKPTKGTTALALLLYFKELILSDKNNMLIFLSNDLEEILLIDPSISYLVEQGNNLVLVDKRGNYTINSEDRDRIPNFKDYLQTIKLTKKDKLQFKLIRHIGHYQKYEKNEPISCQKYLYDCNECKNEIIELLYEKIIEEIDFEKTFALQFHIPCSRWAENCFLTIHQKFINNYSGIYKGIIFDEEPNICEQVVLLADVIKTGKTFRTIYKELTELYPKAAIKSYCVIETYNKEPKEELGYNIEVKLSQQKEVKVYCLLRRKQVSHPISDESCEMCQKNLDITPIDRKENIVDGRLSSFQMWSMIFESGITDEIIEVKRGPKKGFNKKIPNTLDIVKKNGGLLAIKFKAILKENNIQFPKSGYIVYPDETENDLEKYKHLADEEVPSSLFIYSLKLIYDYNKLGIPRSIINIIKNDKSKLSNLKTNFPQLHNELLRTEGNDVIIVDEFPRTYSTYKTILDILGSFEISPILYFTLFNFNPEEKERYLGMKKHLNFYEFQIS